MASIHLMYVRISGKKITLHQLPRDIHLEYVKIPGKGIEHVLSNIHLEYVRIPGEGITM
jgi:hypothetical protein